jgi:hypothetical protein
LNWRVKKSRLPHYSELKDSKDLPRTHLERARTGLAVRQKYTHKIHHKKYYYFFPFLLRYLIMAVNEFTNSQVIIYQKLKIHIAKKSL